MVRKGIGRAVMTPEQFGNWLPPVSIAACMVAGFAIVIVSARTGWVQQALKWATVSFAAIGALLVLTPKWNQVAVEYKDFKATISKLEEEKASLVAQNATLNSQISLVSYLGQADYKSAKDAVDQIEKTKSQVLWADFLPSSPGSFAISVSPESPEFTSVLANKLNVTETDVTRAFDDTGFTILKAPTVGELSNTPASKLWVSPK